MRAVRILVSHEILAQALRLPEDTVVYDCRQSHLYGTIELSLTSPQFPELAPGAAIPLVSAKVSHHEDGIVSWTFQWQTGME